MFWKEEVKAEEGLVLKAEADCPKAEVVGAFEVEALANALKPPPAPEAGVANADGVLANADVGCA